MKLRKRGAAVEPVTVVAAATGTPTRPEDLSIEPGGTRLGELLVDAGLASADQVRDALGRARHDTGKRVGQLLVELRTLTEVDLARMVAQQHRLDVVDLREVTPEADALALLDEATAR